METLLYNPEVDSNSSTHHQRSPFHSIPLEENQKIKIWDLDVPSRPIEINSITDKEVGGGTAFGVYKFPSPILIPDAPGRMRILAVCNKKPLPLENIKYAISFASPADSKKYIKSRANHIVTGRYLQSFVTGNVIVRNTGVIGRLETLKGFPAVVLMDMMQNETLPNWVDLPSFLATSPK